MARAARFSLSVSSSELSIEVHIPTLFELENDFHEDYDLGDEFRNGIGSPNKANSEVRREGTDMPQHQPTEVETYPGFDATRCRLIVGSSARSYMITTSSQRLGEVLLCRIIHSPVKYLLPRITTFVRNWVCEKCLSYQLSQWSIARAIKTLRTKIGCSMLYIFPSVRSTHVDGFGQSLV